MEGEISMEEAKNKTDLRIRKTEAAIKNAFIELRAKKPLEKITVKELCGLAMINKSTFYSHYEDIYALSEAMEQETVASIIGGISHLKDYTTENSDAFTRELCLAFMSQASLIRILFSGRGQSHSLHRDWGSDLRLRGVVLHGQEQVARGFGHANEVLLVGQVLHVEVCAGNGVRRGNGQSQARHADAKVVFCSRFHISLGF